MRRSPLPSVQFPQNNLFTLAGDLPSIRRVLRAAALPVLTRTVVIPKKVIVSGYINLELEYAANTDGSPLCFAAFSAPFAHFVEHRHAQPGLAARTALQLEYQSIDVLDSRTVSQLIILKITVTKLETAINCSQPYTSLPEPLGAAPIMPPAPAEQAEPAAPNRPAAKPPFIKRTDAARRLWTGRLPAKWPPQ